MRSRFAQLSGVFSDALMVVDSQGKILQANAQAASLFGVGECEMNGKPLPALFPGLPLTLLSCWQRPAGSRGRSGQRDQVGHYLELVGSRSDSSQFPAVVTVMPIKIDYGTAAVISIRDLTEALGTQFILGRGLEILTSEDRDHEALLQHLIRAREVERARIAAQIHDATIEMMTAASLRLHQLRFRLGDQAARQVLENFEEALSLSLSHLHRLIFDLRPPGLEHGSLGAALRVYLEQMHSDTGIAYRLDDRLSAHAPDGAALLIYANVREALANVRKHARANTVAVELLDVEDDCLIRIVDDGVGYNPADVEDRPGHLGLVLMRERAELGGGWCRIESSPGAGTIVEFWIAPGGFSTEPDAGS